MSCEMASLNATRCPQFGIGLLGCLVVLLCDSQINESAALRRIRVC